MIFLIAESFFSALMKLTARDREKVLAKVLELRKNPAAPNLQLHSIDRSRDPGFRSVRVDRDFRIIVHVTKSTMMVCYADHHDSAYRWAERRRIQSHPRTQAMQIVEVEEVIERQLIQPEEKLYVGEVLDDATLFGHLSDDELLSYGVPEEWLNIIKSVASEDSFLEMAEHLPQEAQEALLLIATGEELETVSVSNVDPLEHPDAGRRFRVFEDIEELEKALDFPWEKWAVYLHPRQRQLVNMKFNGPARVLGAAGTGKTVVALHRVSRLLSEYPQSKVLLTTITPSLTHVLEKKLSILLGVKGVERYKSQYDVHSIKFVAGELFQAITGSVPNIVSDDQMEMILQAAADEVGVQQYSSHFLLSEWRDIVEAWRVSDVEEYRTVSRSGRGLGLQEKQRVNLWPVFEVAYRELAARELTSWARVCDVVYDHYKTRSDKPYTHAVIDEAQDVGVSELRMIAAIVEDGEDNLFFSGDSGQRILQRSFKWIDVGLDLRGRSHILRVNYRTSHQIHRAVEKVLPPVIEDDEGIPGNRNITISIFNGSNPVIRLFDDRGREVAAVIAWLTELIGKGFEPEEIGVFVRSKALLLYAEQAVDKALKSHVLLPDQYGVGQGRVSIGLMQYAKGLEFKAVAVMGCDKDMLPLQEEMEFATDEVEQREFICKEKHLFYVACSRAREELLVTGLKPGSEFLMSMGVDIS